MVYALPCRFAEVVESANSLRKHYNIIVSIHLELNYTFISTIQTRAYKTYEYIHVTLLHPYEFNSFVLVRNIHHTGIHREVFDCFACNITCSLLLSLSGLCTLRGVRNLPSFPVGFIVRTVLMNLVIYFIIYQSLNRNKDLLFENYSPRHGKILSMCLELYITCKRNRRYRSFSRTRLYILL